MDNKRKKITLRYHIFYDIVYSIMVYIVSAILLVFLYKKIEHMITEDILYDYIKLSVVINTAIYGLVVFIRMKIKKKKKWVIIIDCNGILYYNGKVCKLQIYQSWDQVPFGTCNIKVSSLDGKKQTCMKHVSKKIKNYLKTNGE